MSSLERAEGFLDFTAAVSQERDERKNLAAVALGMTARFYWPQATALTLTLWVQVGIEALARDKRDAALLKRQDS